MSALEEYNAIEWVPDGEMGFDPGGREVKAAADAMRDELQQELAEANEVIDQWEVKAADLMRERNEAEEALRALMVEHLASGPWCESCGRTTNEVNNADHPGQCNVCAELAEAKQRLGMFTPSRWQRRQP